MSDVRMNWTAVAVLVVFHQVLGMAWYGLFAQPWMNGIGRTQEELQAGGVVPYFISIAAAAMLVVFLAHLLALARAMSAAAGARWGFLLWLFVMLPFAAMHNSFALLPWSVTAIDTGIALVGTVVSGAVLGAWRRR